jgi:hypothetical protein
MVNIVKRRCGCRRRHWVLLALYAGSVTLLLARYGVRHAGDTPRYLSAAENLLSSAPLVDKQASYLGYAVLVAAAQWTGFGEAGVIVFQVFLGAVAVILLDRLGRDLAGPVAGFCAAAFFAVNPDILQYVGFVLTDFAYICFLILTVFLADRAVRTPGWYHLVTLACLTVTALLRPNGWVLPPIIGGYWILRSPLQPRTAVVCTAGLLCAVAAMYMLLPSFRAGMAAEAPVAMLYRGEVLWQYEPWRLRMPEPTAATGMAARDVAVYVRQHPLACAALALTRIGGSLVHVRPFYSPGHNLFIVAVLVPLYLLAVDGVGTCIRQASAKLFAAVVAAHFLIVAATFCDRDGRFLLYVLPFIGLFAAAGMVRILAWRQGRLDTSLVPAHGNSPEEPETTR